jgi:hypothetical protein
MLDMSIIWPPLMWAIVALVILNIFVSIRLISDVGSTTLQKLFQLLLVWLLPIVGGVFVLSLVARPRVIERDPGFTEAGRNPPGIGGNDPVSH